MKPSLARVLSLALCAPCIVAPSWGCQGDGGGDAWGRNGSTIVGHMAPTLAGKTIDGERVALSDLRGQVVLVNVWATWCGPCKKELPELAHLHESLSPKGFSLLGVSVDKRSQLPKVQTMVKQYGLDYPMLFDPEGSAVSGWKISGYPTSVLIGRDGTIRWRRNGMILTNDPELRRQLDAALAEAAP